MELNKNNDEYRVQPQEQEENVMSLRDLWDLLLGKWKWFALSVLVCVGFARLYLATKNNVYQRTAVVMVKDENSGSRFSSRDALMQINGMMMGSEVADEAFVLNSHMLIKNVVKKLNLDVMYFYKSSLKTTSLYEEKPFQVMFVDGKYIPSTFKVKVLNAQECELTGFTYVDTLTHELVESEDVLHVRFGERVNTGAGCFMLIPEVNNLAKFEGKMITVRRLTLEQATSFWKGAVNAQEVSKKTSLVSITCTDTNVKRAEDFLNTLLEAYKQSIVEDKNAVSENTARFIDERIAIVGADLNQVEQSMADFKENNKFVDFSANASTFLGESSTARQRTIQLQAQQAAVKYLLEYLKKQSSKGNLIPTLGGMADAGIQAQIAKYNDLKLQRNRLAENTGELGPTLREMDANLNEMRQTLIASMEVYASSVDLQVRQATAEERSLMGDIARMPQQERTAMEIARQQTIKETLYTYLLNKREETALQLAVTESNVRVVETPYGSNAPISPRRMVIMMIGLVIGLALPFAIFYIYTMLNMGVRGRKDIETYTTIPILAEIPRVKEYIKKDSGIVVGEKSSDGLSEAFRIMRYNLSFLSRDAKVIMFTSTAPGEGKSFVSRNFAHILGVKNNRVLLVDCDIRRRTQSGVLNSQQRGLTDYLSGAVEDVHELIVQIPENKKVKLLPAGSLPPNPVELLMDERFEKLIAQLREEFDYIVLDSVPSQGMADAGLTSRVADLSVYVVRVGGIDRRFLSELDRMYKDNRYKNMCVMLNAVPEERRHYGYSRYGYSRYGYSYGGYGYGGYGNVNSKSVSYPVTVWRKIKRVLGFRK